MLIYMEDPNDPFAGMADGGRVKTWRFWTYATTFMNIGQAYRLLDWSICYAIWFKCL